MNDTPIIPVTLEVGIDIVETARVERMVKRWGDRFLNRFFTPDEQQQLKNRSERMAGLIAAKEAASKALGLGLRGLGWKEMEIIHSSSGKPTLRLHGRASVRAKSLGWMTTTISMTHDAGVTAAVVVALGRNETAS